MNYRVLTMITSSLTLGAMMSGCSNQTDNQLNSQINETPLVTVSLDKKVDEIYACLTPEERLAQLQCIYMSDILDENKQLDTAKCQALIPHGIGHFAQYASSSQDNVETLRDQVKQIQEWLVANSTAKLPALFHEEVLSGVAARGATVYPQQLGQACSFNTELATEKTRQTAKVMRAIGGYLSLSPMVDVVRNPYFNRLEESYGEDAYLSAAFGTAFVKGLQDGGLDKGVAACSKHFLGYGGGGDAEEKELMEEILLPHEAMIRTAGSKVVMTGYHKFRGTQCIANRTLMQDILRNYLHFDGVMVSDYFSIGQNQAEPDGMHQAAASINAGNDVDFPIIANYNLLPQAIKEGLVTEETFETAVKRVLRLKAAVGLLDEHPVFCSEGKIKLDTKEERQTAYNIAVQSIVMLKNDGILPILPRQRVALVGPNANSMWAMLGDYTYHAMQFFWKQNMPSPNDVHIVTLKEAMETKSPLTTPLLYSCGCDWTENVETKIATTGDERVQYVSQERRIERDEEINRDEALEYAHMSDVVVAAMGENDLLSGENRDRGSLRLPGKQEQFVRDLIETGTPVVLVLFGGRAQVLGSLADDCAAVIQAWYPGEEGGNAVADILYGNVNPSGKLSVSYPRVELNEPICYNNDTAPDQRIHFPFGYGLSYTTFDYADLKTTKEISTDANHLLVQFKVKNTGLTEGDEIVQLYLSPTSIAQPLKPIKLIGFGRVSLKAGESKTVEFLVSPQQMGYYDNAQWIIEPGEYDIKVGASSQDIRLQETVSLVGNTQNMPLRTNYFSVMRIETTPVPL